MRLLLLMVVVGRAGGVKGLLLPCGVEEARNPRAPAAAAAAVGLAAACLAGVWRRMLQVCAEPRQCSCMVAKDDREMCCCGGHVGQQQKSRALQFQSMPHTSLEISARNSDGYRGRGLRGSQQFDKMLTARSAQRRPAAYPPNSPTAAAACFNQTFAADLHQPCDPACPGAATDATATWCAVQWHAARKP